MDDIVRRACEYLYNSRDTWFPFGHEEPRNQQYVTRNFCYQTLYDRVEIPLLVRSPEATPRGFSVAHIITSSRHTAPAGRSLLRQVPTAAKRANAIQSKNDDIQSAIPEPPSPPASEPPLLASLQGSASPLPQLSGGGCWSPYSFTPPP